MLKTTKLAVFSGSAAILACGLAPSAFADSCESYGKLSMQQQKDNEANKCGLSGSEWSSDLKAHVAWCSGVSPQDWQAMLKKRQSALESCKNK